MLTLFLLLASLNVSAPSKAAERMPVDRDRQSSMFQRIFSYDKHLRNSPRIVVLVVATAPGSSDAQKMAAAFREQGMYPAIVMVDDERNVHTALKMVASDRNTSSRS